jgi:tetratricopeptide (TPR) repeat protein
MEKWEEYLDEAGEAWEEENFSECIKWSTKAIDAGCREIKIYSLRGYCNLEIGNYREAVHDLDIYLVKKKGDLMMTLMRGIAHLNLQNLNQALADFNKALKKLTDDKDAYYYRGVTLSYLEKHKMAIKDLDKAVKLGCNEELLYRQRGLSHYCLNQLEAAKNDLIKHTKLRDTDAPCFFILGKIEQESGNLKKAIKYISRAIYIDGEKSEYYISRMHLYLQTDQGEKSTADFHKAMEVNPDHVGMVIGGKFIPINDLGKAERKKKK